MKLSSKDYLRLALCSLAVWGSISICHAQVKTDRVVEYGTQRKSVEGSKNPNGAGNADFVINSSDFQPDSQVTVFQLLQTGIKGFGEGKTSRNDRIGGRFEVFQIRGEFINFVIDGLYVQEFYTSHKDGPYGYIKQYLESITTDQLLGIEVIYPGKYNQAYINRYKPVTSPEQRFDNYRQVWIEITTRHHNTKINEFGVSSSVERAR